MASTKEKVKKFLGLDEDFQTHTEKKHTVDEEVYEATPAEIAAHDSLALPPGKVILPVEATSDKPKVEFGADPFDTNLDRFRYTKDEKDLDYWEFSEGANPLTVPKDVKKKYPELRFHFRSKARIDRLGMDYMGWQKFSDKSLGYAEGLNRGSDLILFAMPEERAQRYNDKCAADSTQRVIELQEQQMELNSRAAAAGLQPYEAKGEGTSGIAVGERPAMGKRPAGQHRGLSREEVVERITKQQEARARGRVTFDMGRR